MFKIFKSEKIRKEEDRVRVAEARRIILSYGKARLCSRKTKKSVR